MTWKPAPSSRFGVDVGHALDRTPRRLDEDGASRARDAVELADRLIVFLDDVEHVRAEHEVERLVREREAPDVHRLVGQRMPGIGIDGQPPAGLPLVAVLDRPLRADLEHVAR